MLYVAHSDLHRENNVATTRRFQLELRNEGTCMSDIKRTSGLIGKSLTRRTALKGLAASAGLIAGPGFVRYEVLEPEQRIGHPESYRSPLLYAEPGGAGSKSSSCSVP